MKKAIVLLLFALSAPLTAVVAQNIALGERAPELKIQSWLDGRQPAEAAETYVEFFQSSNRTSHTSVERLKEISDKLGAKLRIVIVVREKEDKIGPLLRPYLSERIGVGFDPAGRLFTAYGVSYIPFGVLLDGRNRALWMGNTLQLTPEIIEKSR